MTYKFPEVDNKYKVFVRCPVFNHKPYLLDALRGFTMQKTNFQFVVTIEEDYSTDGSRELLEKYIKEECINEDTVCFDCETSSIIRTKSQSNHYCIFVFYLFKFNHYSKRFSRERYLRPWRNCCEFEAICEGDDYWTDPLKLQKQVEFLDNHLDYSMCFTNAIEHWESGIKEDKLFSNIENREYDGVELLQNWIVPTASMMYRTRVMTSSLYQTASKDPKLIYGDIVLCLSSAHTGRVYGMSDLTCVYRRLETGAVRTMNRSHSVQLQLCLHILEIGIVFGDKYKDVSKTLFHDRCIIAALHNLKTLKVRHFFEFVYMSLKVSVKGTLKAFIRLIQNKKK